MSSTLGQLEFEGSLPQDVKYDYYGKKAAIVLTGKVVIYNFDTEGNSKKVAELSGHEGPILCCSWAHPQFGSIIATGGFDGKVIIHKENNKVWEKLYTFSDLKFTLNCLSFNNKPNKKSYLQLICGYADGSINLITYNGNDWQNSIEKANLFGVTCLSWISAKHLSSKALSGFFTGGTMPK